MTVNTILFTIAAPSVFDWTAPASGQVSNISTNTLNSQWTSFQIIENGVPIGAQPTSPKNMYRDSGLTFAPDFGAQGSVFAHAGGHNDYAGNDTYRFDLETATWEQWKAPHSPVYRTVSGRFDSEATNGCFLNATGVSVSGNPPEQYVTRNASNVISNVLDPDGVLGVTGQPGSTHSYSHGLQIPPGIIGANAYLWRNAASLGWSQARHALYPFHYTDLGTTASPGKSNAWVHADNVPKGAVSYSNGSAYYDGKVYVFNNLLSGAAEVVDLATMTQAAPFAYSPSFQNGAGWVNYRPITDAGQTYFLLCTGTGVSTTPVLRLINVTSGEVTIVLADANALFPSANGHYYSVCWAQSKRAVYFVPWLESNKIYRAAAGANITAPWTLSVEDTATFLLPDTGSQMKPRSFFVNGCIVNFPRSR
jgi:hypothetical protein